MATLHRVYGCCVGAVGIYLMCLLWVWVGLEEYAWNDMARLGPVVVPELGLIIGLVVAVWSYVVLLLWAGECLANTKHYGYCIAFACLNCLYLPLGTALGVATLCILPRRRFRVLFRPGGPPRRAPAEPATE